VEIAHPSLTLALALAAGVLAQSVARHARMPGIVVLLAAGVALGPDGLGLVEPRSLGRGLFGVVEIAVAVILFEGGLNLDISRLRAEQTPIRRLVTFGALITLVGATLTVRLLLDWPWSSALLFGSLAVVTGPTVVGPLLRELRLRPRVATVLEAEGVLIDPIGAILAALALEIALAPDAGAVASGGAALLFRIGLGAGAGALGGFVLVALLRSRRIVPEGFGNIFTLASVLLLFEGCEFFISASGVLAVAVAGVVVGNVDTRVTRDLREFKDQLTVLLIGLLFVLLAADVRLADVQGLGWGGVGVLAILVLLLRPLNVGLSTARSDLTGPERLFVGWIAPRGIVAAALASLAAAEMERRGMVGSVDLRALVFLTIGGTVLLAGLTARPAASLLGLRLPQRETVAILGAQGLGFALARELREGDVPVLLIDSNPGHCRDAEEAGFPIIYGNALEERTLQRARFEQVGTAIGLTPNETLNSVFVEQARDLFRVPTGYVALESLDSGVTPELISRYEARTLFDDGHDVQRWDVRFRHGDLVVERFTYRSPDEEGGEAEAVPSGERYVILSIRRDEKVSPMFAGFGPREGDVASVALYGPERAEAIDRLRRLGWELAT
jgi:NhaP-type Na+/H+ or K+/H+ antiporter